MATAVERSRRRGTRPSARTSTTGSTISSSTRRAPRDGPPRPRHIDIEAVTDTSLTLTIEGASTIELTILDRDLRCCAATC
jgi:hypothetical protein